jgi:hypothetical protein
MLIPRFTLRLLLAVTTASGVFFFVVMQATRSHAWAIAITAAVAGLLATLVFHALWFLVAWLLTICWQLVCRRPATHSPFATAGPPSQIIPPVEPE